MDQWAMFALAHCLTSKFAIICLFWFIGHFVRP